MISAADILDSGGKHPGRVGFANQTHIANATCLVERVNALFSELGIDLQPQEINDGFRLQWATYGAKNSWHKRGGAVDLNDPNHSYAKRITRLLLMKHKLRREDTDFTQKLHDDGTMAMWCHLDIGDPSGKVFRP